MKLRLLSSGAVALASASLVVGATYAFFSDVGTSNDNVFNAGDFDMQLSDDNETDADNVTGTWGLASAPGDTFTGDLEIKNTGSVAADHIELKFDNVMTEGSGPGAISTTPMDTVIEITALDWDSDGDGTTDTNLLTGLSAGSNGIIDLDDLENLNVDGAVDFDNVPFGGTQGSNHKLHMEGRLHPTLTTDEHQGDKVTMGLEVTMNQDASQ